MKVKSLKKTNVILIFIFLVVFGLQYASYYLVPITFAIFFSALVLPFSNLTEKKLGFGKLASSALSTFVVFVGLGLVIYLMIHQLNLLLKEIINNQESILTFLERTQDKVAEETGFSIEQQEEMLNQNLSDLLNLTQKYLANFLTNILDVLIQFLILLLFLFLFLLNREKFVKFLMMYIPKEKEEKTLAIIGKTSRVSHKYLFGRFKVMLLLAVMYFIAFTAYDLKYSSILLFFGVLITIIPYIGPFLSGLFPILVMLIFGGSVAEIVSFTIIIVVIQLIESYVLEPIIIGSEVQQSPLFVLIAVFLGGMIWGGAGLVLFVPIFAILKIIFDHTENLRPVGYLMGYGAEGNKKGLFKRLKERLSK